MASPEISKCVSIGLTLFKKNPLTHIISTVLIGLLGGVSVGLLIGPMMVGYMRMIEKEMRGGKAVVGELFQGFNDFLPALVAFLVSSGVVLIGLFFHIIPGLLIMALVPSSIYLVAQGKKDGIDAFKSAWRAVMPNLLNICLCMVVLSVLGGAGIIVFGFGIVLTMPIAMIGMQVMARQLFDSNIDIVVLPSSSASVDPAGEPLAAVDATEVTKKLPITRSKKKLFLLMVVLIFVYLLDQKNFWPIIVFAMLVMGRLFWGFYSRCPVCNEWWAAIDNGSDLLSRWQESRDIEREDVTRGKNGEELWRTKRIDQILVNCERRRNYYNCRYCNADWDEVVDYED